MKDKTLITAALVLYVLALLSTVMWARAEGRTDGAVAECHAQYGAQVESIRERMEAQTVTVDSLLRAIAGRQQYYSQGGR